MIFPKQTTYEPVFIAAKDKKCGEKGTVGCKLDKLLVIF